MFQSSTKVYYVYHRKLTLQWVRVAEKSILQQGSNGHKKNLVLCLAIFTAPNPINNECPLGMKGLRFKHPSFNQCFHSFIYKYAFFMLAFLTFNLIYSKFSLPLTKLS